MKKKHPVLYFQTVLGTFLQITGLILQQPHAAGTTVSSMIQMRELKCREQGLAKVIPLVSCRAGLASHDSSWCGVFGTG